MLWVLIAKDTLYLHKRKPIILKPVETTVEEENFRQRFSINELVYPRLINRGYVGAGVHFYQMIGGMIPTVGYSFSMRGFPPTSNALYVNGIPLLNLMLSSLAPLPVSEDIISSALVYRGDAPIEYDGFLGGAIDMSVEPYGGAAKIGVPTTYIFHRGFYGQYSNPTYVRWYDEPRWRTENYSGAVIQRLFGGRANLSVLYAHTWLDFKGRFKGFLEKKESRFWDETDMVGVSLRVLDNLRAHLSYGSTGNILKNTYGSLLFGSFSTRRLLGGVVLRGGNFGVHLTYDRADNRSDLFYIYGFSFYSEHLAVSPFAEMKRETERMKLYVGGRVNVVYTTSGPGKYEHSLRGVIPTFRLKIKYFKGENEAYKATLSTSYQYTSPFFPIGNVNLLPSSYFNRYPYGGMLTLGRETLHKLAITELNVYLGAYDPFVFYDWNWSSSTYEGSSAETFLKYAVNATVLSYGVDLTLTDRTRNRFRISATLGGSRFVRGVEGASPWERRYSLSLSTPYFSIIFAEGIPTYGWYYTCVQSEGPMCQEYEVTYTYNRTSPTLMVGSGKELSFRGFSVGFGVGNFLFFFNRLISTSYVDPTAVFLAYPIVYLHVAKRW